MKKSILIILTLFTILSFSSCNTEKLPETNLEILKSDGSKITLNVEIAANEQDRAHGYMERKNIPDGTGMIFIFEKDQILSFWMKNTPHPLSIAYISSEGTIKDLFDMTPYSLSNITSTSSVRYALEVPQGWFDKNNIKKGDKINISQFK